MRIIEITYVDEAGNIEVLHPMTDIQSVEGLEEALQSFLKTVLPLDGGSMKGNIDMAGYAIQNLPEPEEAADPVTKSFMEEYVTEVFLGGEW